MYWLKDYNGSAKIDIVGNSLAVHCIQFMKAKGVRLEDTWAVSGAELFTSTKKKPSIETLLDEAIVASMAKILVVFQPGLLDICNGMFKIPKIDKEDFLERYSTWYKKTLKKANENGKTIIMITTTIQKKKNFDLGTPYGQKIMSNNCNVDKINKFLKELSGKCIWYWKMHREVKNNYAFIKIDDQEISDDGIVIDKEDKDGIHLTKVAYDKILARIARFVPIY